MGWKENFQAQACQKQGIQNGTDDRMNGQCLFLCSETGRYRQKGEDKVDMSVYRRREEREDMEDSVFGRSHDSMELMAELGSTGYMQRFYEFLQGKFHPEKIMDKDAPNLSGDQAWHVIYCMQEYFGVFDDRFERCRECDTIFDSYEEGTAITEDTEPVEKYTLCEGRYVYRFTEEEYGHYCEDCRPD